jgi:hypothetical protein
MFWIFYYIYLFEICIGTKNDKVNKVLFSTILDKCKHNIAFLIVNTDSKKYMKI